ncbi:MAG: hypothetical protein QXT73_02270 [Candidatus Methanomethylicaceae archaeon]
MSVDLDAGEDPDTVLREMKKQLEQVLDKSLIESFRDLERLKTERG